MTPPPDRFVTCPELTVEESGDEMTVENLLHCTKLRASKELLVVLQHFAKGASLAAFLSEYELDRDSVDELIDTFILIPEPELAFLKKGSIRPAAKPIGTSATYQSLRTEAKAGGYAILGAPVDIATTGEGGARHGPAEVRQAFPIKTDGRPGLTPAMDLEFRRHYHGELSVHDLGDVFHQPGESLEHFGRRLQKMLDRALEVGLRPVVIGGDHSVSWFALERLLERTPALGVLHFDAHHDLYASRGRELSHANPFTFALEKPSLKHLFQLGLRTLEWINPDTDPAFDPRIRYLSSRELQRMTPEQVFAGLPKDLPWYLSFDVDSLQPWIAGETGTRVPGGLDYYQGLELIDHFARSFDVVGADFVEVGRHPARHNSAAQVTASYLANLLLSRVPFTPLEGYSYRCRKPYLG